MIEMIRIDDRLLHGQVAVAWTKELKVNEIVIANDLVVKDDFKKLTLNLAKPMDVDLKIVSVDEAIEYVNSEPSKKRKILVIIDNTEDALRLAKEVVGVKSLNIGGMRMKPGKKMISNAVAVDSKDIELLREIDGIGIEIEIRQVPTEKKTLFKEAVKG